MNITEIKELLAGTPTAEQLATLAADERKGVQKLLAAYNKRLEKAAAEKERFTAMLKLERELYDEGCELIAGVDEAGRGPLAGPLVIAAVILPEDVFISGLNDSKQLSAAKRDMLYNEVMAKALDIEVNIVSVSNIDELNIYAATQQGMAQVLENLHCKPQADSVMLERPFRSPHHSISGSALLGGGSTPRPGEVTLAHNGVLFLDELPEFERATLEMLRQPLEDGEVSISRVRAAMTFPSKFILCAAQNPCPCGFLGDSVHRCSCKQSEIDSYKRKISGPLMDRIDMQINLSRVEFSELKTKEKGEASAVIRERVVKARLVQQERLEALGMHCNAQMGRSEVVKYCRLDAAAQNVMERYFNMLNLSARSHDRILKVARTIADLAGSESIEAVHLAEAIQLRTSVRP